MDAIIRISALTVVTAVLCVVIRQSSKPLALLLTLAACIGVYLLGLEFLTPIQTVVQQLQRLSGLSDAVTRPLWKVVGIGLLSQTASGLCADAGESALAKTVELSGSLLALYAALPLLSSVLTLLEQLVGGAG